MDDTARDNVPRTTANVMEFWDKVIADMEATAEEYRENGWETVELHPGDVAMLTKSSGLNDKYGLDVLVPGNEMDKVDELVEERGVEFDSFEVYKAMGSELMYAVIVMKDEDNETALLYPVYYAPDSEMITNAQDEGEMVSYVRDLPKERGVKLVHDDISLFMPDTSESESGG